LIVLQFNPFQLPPFSTPHLLIRISIPYHKPIFWRTEKLIMEYFWHEYLNRIQDIKLENNNSFSHLVYHRCSESFTFTGLFSGMEQCSSPINIFIRIL
jgi:hypothetical protein